MQMRLYEIDGKNTDGSLNFPGSPTVNAWESMGNEYGVYGNKLTTISAGGTQKVTLAGVGHNQIRSLKVQTAFAPVGVAGGRSPGSPGSAGAVGTMMRLYNVKGQMVWHGETATMRQGLARSLPAGGLYIEQHLAKDGSPLESRRMCGIELYCRP